MILFPDEGELSIGLFGMVFFNEVTPLLNTMTYVFDQPGERFFFTDNERRWQWHEACLRASGLFMAFLASCSIDANHAVVLAVPSCRLFGGAALKRNRKIAVSLLVLRLVWMVESCLAANGDPTSNQALPTPPEQNKIAEVLLRNIYRSFDYLQDADVYRHFREVLMEIIWKSCIFRRGGLILTEQGGAYPSPNVQWPELNQPRT